jgi:hypothetical protein
MRRFILLIIIIFILTLLSVNCSKEKPSEFIIGEWKGKSEFSISDGKPSINNVILNFSKDGSVVMIPENQPEGGGRYEIDNEGNLTVKIIPPKKNKVIEFNGSLDPGTNIISLSAKIEPTEQEMEEIVNSYLDYKEKIEGSGEDFTQEMPVKEDFVSEYRIELEKVIEKKD